MTMQTSKGRLSYTVAKNAIANVVRGGATAIVALALPHFLVKALDPGRFSAWSLILQIAAYASYLDFGLQTAVARFLAQAIELKQRERLQQLVSTALTLLASAGCLAFLVLASVVALMPKLFHGIPPGLLHEVQIAALVLGASAALLLPGSVYTGVLIGLQKNEYPALAIGSSRLVGACCAIVASHFTNSLIVLAACIALPNQLGSLLQWRISEGLLPGSTNLKTRPQFAVAKELLGYCTGLMVFSFGMLLYSGLDLTIIAHFAFSEVGYYSIAATLIVFVAGLQSALINALLAPMAALHARGAFDRIRTVILSSTQFTTGINLLLTFIFVFYGRYLLHLWVGSAYARRAYPIVILLMIAQLVRQTAAPYCVMLIASGNQLNLAEAAIFEALLNLIASVWLASFMGAMGVAWGTLIGAICGLVYMTLRIFRKQADVCISSKAFLQKLIPVFICGLPACIACLTITRRVGDTAHILLLVRSTSLLITLALLVRYANLIPQEISQRVRDKFA
jgi:O-antigen/teichoic acid export membrane protein